jgi:hypothetical protein
LTFSGGVVDILRDVLRHWAFPSLPTPSIQRRSLRMLDDNDINGTSS